MHAQHRTALSLLCLSVLALAIVGGAGIVWGALVYANIRSAPTVPWALPVLLGFLWAIWRYLGGAGWPNSSSRLRRSLLRANPVSRRALGWSLLAGASAIAALAGLWIVLFRLALMGVNPLLPSSFTSSPALIIAITIGASLLAPVTEESAFRGYLQGSLERSFGAPTAIVLSSIVFAIAHVSQGLSAPKLFFYFLVGVVFGVLAYVNASILPVIPVHIAADLTFFLFVWPYDSARQSVWFHGPDVWFWAHVTQFVVFTVLWIVAVRTLHRVHVEDQHQISSAGA